jgi:hypothetical protein
VREALWEAILRESQQELNAFPVLDLCAVDPYRKHQALGVHKKVALSALDLLAPIVVTLFSTYPGCLNRLAIHYPGAGLRISLETYPHPLA